MTEDVLLAKIASIEHCLDRIRTVTRGDPQSLETIDTEEIVVLNLQRAIEAAIDLAAHTISENSWGLPDSLKAHFRILVEHGVVEREVGKRLETMVGFRNIAVHDYQSIDVEVLKRIVSTRLIDLEALVEAMKRARRR